MAVMGYEKMYLAVLVLSKAFYHFCIKRDDAEIAALMEQEKGWWEEYVEGDSVPDPDGSEEDGAFIRERFPAADGGEVFLGTRTPDFEELSELDAQIRELSARRDALKQAIMQDMGDATLASALNGWTASWKPQVSNRVDSRKLKAEFPQVYADCLIESVSRVFRYKKAK